MGVCEMFTAWVRRTREAETAGRQNPLWEIYKASSKSWTPDSFPSCTCPSHLLNLEAFGGRDYLYSSNRNPGRFSLGS